MTNVEIANAPALFRHLNFAIRHRFVYSNFVIRYSPPSDLVIRHSLLRQGLSFQRVGDAINGDITAFQRGFGVDGDIAASIGLRPGRCF